MDNVANVVATICDELVAVLQKHSAALRSGDSGIGNIANSTSVGGKRKRSANDKKDPNKPKKAISAYIFYMMEQQPIFKLENPTVNQTDVMTILGKGWTELDAEKKDVYQKRADSAKIEKSKEMADYVIKNSSSSVETIKSPAAKLASSKEVIASPVAIAAPNVTTAPTVINAHTAVTAATLSAVEKAEKKKNRKPRKLEGVENTLADEVIEVSVPETIQETSIPDSTVEESDKKKVFNIIITP